MTSKVCQQHRPISYNKPGSKVFSISKVNTCCRISTDKPLELDRDAFPHKPPYDNRDGKWAQPPRWAGLCPLERRYFRFPDHHFRLKSRYLLKRLRELEMTSDQDSPKYSSSRSSSSESDTWMDTSVSSVLFHSKKTPNAMS